jgi:homoserine dehydrogenase
MNMAIKLLGLSRRYQNGSMSVRTAPFLVRADHPLHSVQDVFNGVFIHGNMVDDIMFYGRGAGKFPTASAVVSDVIECARNIGRTVGFRWDDEVMKLSDPEAESYRYFVRADQIEAEKAGALLGQLSVVSHDGAPEGEIAFVTPRMTEKEFRKAESALHSVKQCIRLLEDQ